MFDRKSLESLNFLKNVPIKVRGSVEEQTQTLDFSIGKNSSEGKTHMMCIEGTEGTYIGPG